MPSPEEVLASMPSLTRGELDRRAKEAEEKLAAERRRVREEMLARDTRGGLLYGEAAAARSWSSVKSAGARRSTPKGNFASPGRRTVERPEKATNRVDKSGRTIKEVWVSGFKYKVVD